MYRESADRSYQLSAFSYQPEEETACAKAIGWVWLIAES
jgi:hypothetical protein